MFLSIITVTYNCSTTIERTIQSVISQMACDIEYIIIDGNSTDGTKEIISNYSENLSYWISEDDDGIYNAMNKGIDIAKGDWIAFINGNDWYIPDILEKVRKIANKTKASILYGYVNAFVNGKQDGYVGISEPVALDMIYFGNLYCHQGLFIRRELFSAVGKYDSAYRVFADHDWNIRAHKRGYDPYIMGFAVANYTVGGISTIEAGSDEASRIIIKHYRDVSFFPSELERLRGRTDFDYLRKKYVNTFSMLIPNDKQVFLWGVGKNGQECFDILSFIGRKPLLAIDSGAKFKSWNGIDVLTPECFWECKTKQSLDFIIIISTEKYENEIQKEVVEHDVSRNEYITMTEIYKWSYEHNNFL